MSRAPLENVNINETPDTGDRQYPPQSAQNQTWRGESNFVDSSGPIFSMYLEMAEEEDKKMAESWKADAEGILVFTGLFSAAVASLISVSIQDIRQNPQDTSNFYLANIYQAISDPNRSNLSSSPPTSPPSFSPPTYAVWVNSLWFLSLVISITCALLATLLQQWARRYLNVTQTRSSLHKRARIRSFFAEGVKKSHLSMVVEALPTLIHVSVSLFFAGLVVFLWNVNLTIFKLVLSWIGVCTAFYGCITFIPMFLHDSPYYSPLTPLARPVVGLILVVFMILSLCLYFLALLCSLCFRYRGPVLMFGHLLDWFNQVAIATVMAPKVAALKSSPEIDTRAFTWTFDSLDEDHELDRFFAGMPGFHNSKVLKEPLHNLDDRQKLKLLEAVIRLLDRTLSSNLLSDKVKRKRADICAKAIEVVETPDALPQIVRRLVAEDGYGSVQSAQIVDFVRRWGDRKGNYSALDQAIFSIIVVRVQQRDNSWFNLAGDHLGVPETVLRSHATHGDNLSFAILIYVTRQQLVHIHNPSWPFKVIANVLEAASKFNVQDTSPELQHEFCALWNQVIREVRKRNDQKISERILKPIHHVYIRLHHDMNSTPTQFSASTSESNDILHEPDRYLGCNDTGHVHDGSPSIPFPRPVQNVALPPVSCTSSEAPSLSVPASLHVDGCLTALPPPDNSYPTDQTVYTLRVPVTLPDPATAGAMRDIVAAGVTAPGHSPKASTSTSPPPSAPRPLDVSLHNANPLTPSDLPNLPPLAPNTALDNILHSGPSQTSHSPMTQSDLSPSYRSITATTALSASDGIISMTDPGASLEHHGNPVPGLREANDALRPPAGNRAMRTSTLITLDPQSPSLPPVADSDRVIAGRSQREQNDENTGDRPPHPSRNQYDIV